jgi:hypothetical protein
MSPFAVVLVCLCVVTAQPLQPLVPAEYAALNAFLDGLGCGSTKCPRFLANESCAGTVLCNGGSVTSLDLSSRGLSGTLDGASVGKLTGLRNLQLERNNLEGVLPTSLAALTRLTYIALFLNSRVRGRLPTQFGQLVSLRVLGLGEMALEGPIPSQWAAIQTLEALDINSNRLSGTLPPAVLASWRSLLRLSLQNNSGLGGTLSDELFAMTNLNTLQLARCAFSGSLPSEVRFLSALRFFDISNNAFVGGLPSLLALTSLTRLRLENNAWTGNPPVLADALVLADCVVQSNSTTAERSCLNCDASKRCACAPRVCPTTTRTTTATSTAMRNTTTIGATAASTTSGDAADAPLEIIAGAAGGGAFLLLLLGLIAFVLVRRRKQKAVAQNPTRSPDYGVVPRSTPSPYGGVPEKLYASASISTFYGSVESGTGSSVGGGGSGNVYSNVPTLPDGEYLELELQTT